MPWFQMDDGFPTHPGALAASLAARGLWATAGAWCSGRLTDVVPNHVLSSFGSTPELVDELRAAGMVEKVRGGWRIVQPGLCKIPAKSRVERDRKSGAARQSRWRDRQRNAVTNAVSDGVSNWAPPIPVPKEPPSPPPGGGHDGSHPNCRACGTNPRGKPPEPRPTLMPPPVADAIAAALNPNGHHAHQEAP